MQLDNRETNSRTTEKWTEKLPTFLKTKAGEKRYLFSPVCMGRELGWAERQRSCDEKGRCQKSTTTHLLDPPWNKPALVNEPNQKIWFPPCRDGNSVQKQWKTSLSADSKVRVFPNIDPDVRIYILYFSQCLVSASFIWRSPTEVC